MSALLHHLVAFWRPCLGGTGTSGRINQTSPGGNAIAGPHLLHNGTIASDGGLNALVLDGVNQYANASQTLIGNPYLSDWTWAGWFKITDGNRVAVIWSKRQDTGSFLQWLLVQGTLDGSGVGTNSRKISLLWFGGGTFPTSGAVYVSADDIVDGNWKHIALVRAEGQSPKLYVNGSLVTFTAIVARTTNLNMDHTAHAMEIGRTNASGGSAYCPTSLDSIGMWKCALSSSDIATLATSRNQTIAETVPTGLRNGLIHCQTGIVQQSTSGNHISMSNGGPLSRIAGTDAGTIMCWVRRPQVAVSGAVYGMLATPTAMLYLLSTSANTQFQVNGQVYSSGAGTSALDADFECVVMRKTGGNVDVWRDGVRVLGPTANTAVWSSPSGTLFLNPSQCHVATFVVWDRGLTDAEIGEAYAAGVDFQIGSAGGGLILPRAQNGGYSA
jgi:hypothetical protein